MRIAILTGVLVLGLASCDQIGLGGDKSTKQEASPKVEPEVSTSAETVEVETAAKPFTITYDQDRIDGMLVPDTLSVALNEDSTITVSGTAEGDKSGGRTSGAAFIIPPGYVRDMAGQNVTISWRAMGEAGSSMRVAYSTAGSGNSGWQSFDLTDTMSEYSFDYKLGDANAGRDFIGIMPVNGPVTLGEITVSPK
ncbi:hypothetical protein [Henriciella litoralis]|uniref:hypothetical protein n=1 Tax=Henriciella litoralis TaxID=568102 RepID=UPI000A028CDB|nr:hypothetical protein [Henriciella litoralis]